jgi:pyruvate dehydrogenase E2 component (dihydrolipoamide acetyltransferase)/2-oxoglutarate dehydrogenase E2 component (dihydrolipoamide succinyltransferase)
MPHDVTMPQLGMAQDAGRIVAWLKKPGERVAAGDALFEVETDKATMEVEAQAGGYLTDVRAGEGEDVPVGRVIARISETAEASAPAPAGAPASATAGADQLPEGRAVTMPQLGMAQDTGVVVAWHVAPGDKVAEGDVLFEVETDKTTMEVPATGAGYVAALLAGEGEEVPVGEAVAILMDAPPAAPFRRTRGGAEASAPVTPAAPPPSAAQAPKTEVLGPAAKDPPPVAPAPLANGRILASPKARKLALERGIDLARLVAAGVPQPFHVRDVEAYKAPAAAPASQRITAETLHDGFTPFAAWAAEAAGIADPAALLAGFAAASLRAATSAAGTICVAVMGQGADRCYLDPDLALGRAAPATDAPPPALVLRDLRHSRITALDTGAGPAPVMTLGGRGQALTISLVWAEGQLTPDAALALADGFAARLEEPLRHLL